MDRDRWIHTHEVRNSHGDAVGLLAGSTKVYRQIRHREEDRPLCRFRSSQSLPRRGKIDRRSSAKGCSSRLNEVSLVVMGFNDLRDQ